MSDWREDNFLERLTHSSSKGAGNAQCPAAELLSATVELEGANAVSDELSRHMKECPVCREIQQRLALFDQGDMADSDPQVIESERRLDSWMKGLLSSRRLNSPSPAAAGVSELVPRAAILKGRPLWSIRWALAAAATIAIAAGCQTTTLA